MPDGLAWHDLMFALPLAIGIAMAAGVALGGLHGQQGDTDTGHGDAGHADAGHDLHHDAHSVDLNLPNQPARRPLGRALWILLGLGRVPLSLVMMVGPLLFGATGWILNAILATVIAAPHVYVWLSLAGATIVSLLATGVLAHLIGRWLPLNESFSTRNEDLVGCVGHLVHAASPITGLAHVHDRRGNLQQVQCRTEDGALAKGAEVLLVSFDDRTQRFIVSQDPLLSMLPAG